MRDEILEQELFEQFRDMGLDDDEAREAARDAADLAAEHDRG